MEIQQDNGRKYYQEGGLPQTVPTLKRPKKSHINDLLLGLKKQANKNKENPWSAEWQTL